MKTKLLFISLGLLLILTNCKKNKVEKTESVEETQISSEIVISGAYALMPVAYNWANEFQKLNPSVKVKVYINGTGEGIKDLLNNKADIAMISRDPAADENNGNLWRISVARDGIGVIINAKNPNYETIIKRGLTQAEHIEIFTSKKPLFWNDFIPEGNKNQIKVYTRSDKSGAASVWANFLFCNQEDLQGTGCEGEIAMIEAIKNDVYGIGYINLNFAFDDKSLKMIPDIGIVPIDQNNNGMIDKKEEIADNLIDFERNVWLGKYPKCLCRYLYLATLKKPEEKNIVEFLKFTQQKGQDIVTSSGLCKLNSIEVENNLLLLK